MDRRSTKSYADRQVDIEILQHVEDPSLFNTAQPVKVSFQAGTRIVSGIEKAVQRYARIFLTQVDTVRADPETGNSLLYSISHGMVQNISRLSQLCSVANASTLASLREEDGDERFGVLPDDERIESASITKMDLIRDALTGGRAEVGVRLTTAAGDDFTFVIPVAAGING